jgi:hypothetical protein
MPGMAPPHPRQGVDKKNQFAPLAQRGRFWTSEQALAAVAKKNPKKKRACSESNRGKIVELVVLWLKP